MSTSVETDSNVKLASSLFPFSAVLIDNLVKKYKPKMLFISREILPTPAFRNCPKQGSASTNLALPSKKLEARRSEVSGPAN